MHINRLVEQFLRRHDFAPTRFGRLTVNDPRLVQDLRAGREIRPATEKRLRNFIAAYRAPSTESSGV